MALEYLVKILADGKQAEAEANRVKGAFEGIGSALSRFSGLLGIGVGVGAAAAVFTKLTNEAIASATEIKELGERADVSLEKIQAWRGALRGTPASIEDLIQSLRFLKLSIVEALGSPTSQAVQWFRLFGVSIDDLKAKRPEAILEQVAAAFAKLPRSAQTTAGLINLMGRNAEALAPAFEKGFDAAIKKILETNKVLKESEINRLFNLGQARERQKAAASRSWARLITSRAMFKLPGSTANEMPASITDLESLALALPGAFTGNTEALQDYFAGRFEEEGPYLKQAQALSRALARRGISRGAHMLVPLFEDAENARNAEALQRLRDIAFHTAGAHAALR